MRHILKPGLWRMDSGRWTFDGGLCTIPLSRNKSLRDVTSSIHASRDLSCCCLFSILPLCHAFNLVFSSRNLDARQRKSILGRAINYFIFFSFPRLSRHEMSISTDHRVFFIYLQDMYQIKQVEPFQRYHLFCGI